MFWSGNYIAVRELNILLKEQNASLTQVLEADDILQECKADNKALIQFLTRPEILAELITLITEEPPKNVELASQYRHASIACEVLTSQLSTLSDRLSLDTVQMNRLCDFINKEPPLNPLLASYFSKTIEMLLERSPKQDWYLYHIVCLRVLDFLRSRRDFLPNLLRHLATSAIADTFKVLLRLDNLFNKTVMEWLDEHQFLECLIQIICGTYVAEPLRPPATASAATATPDAATPDAATPDAATPDAATPDAAADATAAAPPAATDDEAETPVANHKQDGFTDHIAAENNNESGAADGGGEQPPHLTDVCASERGNEKESGAAARQAAARRAEVAAGNAAALLCDLIAAADATDCTTRSRTLWSVVSRLQSARWTRALLAAAFTSPPAARAAALAHAARLLLALLAAAEPGQSSEVEAAVAPHLPLLHQALLQPPPPQTGPGAGAGRGGRVGAARLAVAALLAHLALSDLDDVSSTLLTLGTAGVLVDMFFEYSCNNFLHAHVCTFVRNALANAACRLRYAHHLFVECDLLTRLMDAYEENDPKEGRRPRAGYMGHVVSLLRMARGAVEGGAAPLPAPLHARWERLLARLAPALHHLDTPLGGYYPSDNIYEVDPAAGLADVEYVEYEFNEPSNGAPPRDDMADDFAADGANELGGEQPECGSDGGEDKVSMVGAKNAFLELASQRFDDDMWDDAPDLEDELNISGPSHHDVHDVLAAVSPWDSGISEHGGGGGGGEGCDAEDESGGMWAQFSSVPPPVDPYAPLLQPSPAAAARWPPAPAPADSSATLDVEEGMQNLRLFSSGFDGDERSSDALASNLLSAMSGMAPDLIANIVNANMPTGTHDTSAAGRDALTAGTNTEHVAPATSDSATEPAAPADSAAAGTGTSTDRATGPASADSGTDPATSDRTEPGNVGSAATDSASAGPSDTAETASDLSTDS